MIYIKCLTIHKVKMHTGAIRKLLYVVCVCTGDNNSLKLVGYLPVHTHKPYNNLHFFIYSFIYLFIYFLACILDVHIASNPSMFDDFIGCALD